MERPVIYAHRGASSAAPENTMASFKKALESGADGIELDVHLSREGFLVVAHDEKVERTSNGTGYIKDKTLEELKQLDFGGWFSPEFKNERIPVLDEVLELIRGWDGILNVEIKSGVIMYPGIEKKLIDLIRKFGMSERTIISSFNHYALVESKKEAPDIKTAILYSSGMYKPWEYARRVGAEAIHPIFYNIVPEIMAGCRENGVMVNTWTVDRPADIKKMAEAGVDGIITNTPGAALEVLAGKN